LDIIPQYATYLAKKGIKGILGESSLKLILIIKREYLITILTLLNLCQKKKSFTHA